MLKPETNSVIMAQSNPIEKKKKSAKQKNSDRDSLKERKLKAKIAFNQMKASLTDEDIAALKTMPYKSFLQTKYWKTLKEYVLTHVDNACALCSCQSEKNLELHHRTYQYRGNEFSNIRKSITVLCHQCHQMFHANCLLK